MAVVVMVVMVMTALRRSSHVRRDAAVILTWRAANGIVVGQRWRDGAGEEGRAKGGNQETLHSLFL